MVPRVPWGAVELEPEVADWIRGLPDDEFGRAEFYIDLLTEKGVRLDEPYTRQLRGKLRELRFYLGSVGRAVRITYYIARGRRIVLTHGVQQAAPTRTRGGRSGRACDEAVHRGRAHGGG